MSKPVFANVTVLGSYEVAENGDFANWKTPGRKGGGIGGAMDLAVGAQRVWIAMEHVTRDGKPRLLKRCALPVTAVGVVQRVVTDLGLFDVTPEGFLMREIAPDYTPGRLILADVYKRLRLPEVARKVADEAKGLK